MSLAQVLMVAVLGISASYAELPTGFRQLNVNIPNHCVVTEKQPARTGSDHGPFIRPAMCSSREVTPLKQVEGTVYRVVDGDTIHFYVGPKLYAIRMLGMDTPELHFLGKAQPTWAILAKKNLEKHVRPGDKIVGVFDKQKCDKYGRLLLHVYKNGKNLNLTQIREGYAANYCISPNTAGCADYAKAYAQAQSRRLNIHSDSCFVTPYVWRKAIQELPMDKPVRDIFSGVTMSPDQYYRIPVANRIFFPAGSSGSSPDDDAK